MAPITKIEISFNGQNDLLKAKFAVVPTDKICGQSLSSKIPVDMNSIFMNLYVT